MTLESIGHAVVPTGWNIELVVVDNGSTDQTPEIIHEARLSNMPVRYVREPSPGLSYARNRGLKKVEGEIVLFTDDDVRVPSNWIERMCTPILERRADAVAGQVVFPSSYEEELEKLPDSSLRSWVAGTTELDRHRPTRMVGANMALGRHVLSSVPQFDTELGAGATGFGDDTLFAQQLLAAGFKIAFCADAAVEHHFDISRLTDEALMKIAAAMGRSRAFVFHHWDHIVSHFPTVKALKYGFMRSIFRLRRVRKSAGISIAAIRIEQELAFHREYLIQKRRPRKYAYHGLIPVAGTRA